MSTSSRVCPLVLWPPCLSTKLLAFAFNSSSWLGIRLRRSLGLLNQRGAIQAAQSLSADTQGEQLRNLDSGAQGMVSGGQLTLKAGSLDNAAGYIGSKTGLQVTAQSHVSNQGQMVSEGTASISTGSLDNHQGKLQSAGDLTVQLNQGALNNQQGLLQSGQHLAVTAGAVDNSATHSTVSAAAGGDMTLTGSQVVSDQGTLLQAGGNLTLKEARSTDEYLNHRVEKESGIMGSGGFGITIGSREQGLDGSTRITQATGSTVGAISGDVTLLAGQKYTQTGSSVMATGVNGGGDVNILAKDIAITEARETTQNVTDTWFKQSGLTVAISNPVVNAIQTADQMAKAASNTSDSRMKALAAASTGMSAYSAYKAVQEGQGTTIDGKDNQIKTGKTGADGKPETRDANSADKAGGIDLSISLGSSHSESHSESSSNTSTGSRINAAGSINLVATGAGQDSNILIQGSDLKAAKDIALAADNRIQLQASQDTEQQHGKNSGSSASIGVSIGSSGFAVSANASKSRGHADGDSVSYNNTHLNAGENVSLSSGGDLALKGAVVAGKQITADVGGNLSIESLQDKNHYDSKQQSLGGSLSFGTNGIGGSLSYSKSKVNSDFLSVGEQSGLLAGDGGFNVKVKGDTTLTGGVITSTEQAVQEQKNQFETGGKLAMTDLHNHAEYQASSESVNIGTSMNMQGAWSPSGSGIGFGNDSGSADSDTRSGISGVAGNTAARTGDAQTGLKPIFDADKVQKEVDAQAQITQTFGQQASKLVGDYAAEKMKEANVIQNKAIKARVEGNDAEADSLDAQAKQISDQWGDNGTYRIGLHTVIGGLTGGASGAAGSLTGSLTAAQAADLLQSSGITQENDPALYNALVTLAGTAAGAAVGGTAGASTAFNEVTNNYLKHQQIADLAKKVAACRAAHDSGCVKTVVDEATKLSDANSEAMRACQTRSCLDSHMREINDAALVYNQIQNLAQGGVDVANLAFGNSKTPRETDTRYYLDVIRQNPSLQTPYEKQFYAMDHAKRAGFEQLLFGHPLSEQERYALLTGASGNPIQGVLADAAADYAKGLGVSNQQLAILSIGLGVLKKSGTSVAKPLGLGSTGRTTPANLTEQLAMQQVMSNHTAGRQLPVPMTDPRWPASDGWVKMSQNVNGVEIHYVYNRISGTVDDFKFK